MTAVTVDPLPSSSSPPPVHEHRPSANAFLDAGCKVTDPRAEELLDCKASKLDFLNSCQSVRVLPVSFEPPAVVAECWVRGSEGVRSSGCMLPMAARLVAAMGSGFTTIRTKEELAKAFAPVSSSQEAIAFAVALTGNEEVRTRDKDSKDLGITEVHDQPDGFHVRLFGSQMCGCSHPTWAIDALVTRDGKVSEIARKVVFEDPKSQGLCVD